MGYLSYVTGRIELATQLSVQLVAGSRFLPDNQGNRDYTDVVYEVIDKPLWDRPEATHKLVTAIVPASDDRLKFYDLEQHLAAAVREIRDAGGIVSSLAYLTRLGEGQGDVQRYRFDLDADAVESERAMLRWPDGTPVEGVE